MKTARILAQRATKAARVEKKHDNEVIRKAERIAARPARADRRKANWLLGCQRRLEREAEARRLTKAEGVVVRSNDLKVLGPK